MMRSALAHALQRARKALAGQRRSLAVGLALVPIVFAAFAIFVALFDWNAARGVVERRFAEKTGRALVIGGDLDIRLGWRPRVIAYAVRVGNPDWARRRDLVTARRITLVVSLAALVRGEVRFHEIELLEPQLALEQRDGLKTWAFAGGGAGRPTEIGRLRIEDGVVEFLDSGANTEVTAEISSRGDAAADEVTVSARGTYRGAPFRLRAAGPSVLLLADRSTAYPLEASLDAGTTRARFAGTVTGLPSPSALDLRLEFSGDDLADLRRLIGVGAPSTPPYALQGRLRRTGANWTFDAIEGTIGDSDVAGELAYSPAPRPHLTLAIASQRLDFDDLGPLIGAPPKTTPGETASAEQRGEAQRLKQRQQALPRKPFDFSRWQRMDVDLSLVGRRVVHPPALPIQALEATLQIREGVLRIAPLRLRVAGGEVVATIELDGRKPPLRGAAEMDFRRLALRELFPTVQAMRSARGIAHGRAHLAGTGSSVAELLGSANGRITLAVDHGTISQRVLELIGLDIAESAMLLVTGDREVALHCAVADLGVRDGIATSNVLVVDTEDTLVVGAGIVDLVGERLDLTVYPRPKDMSPLAARTALHVRGPLRDPSIVPDGKGLATRGVTAALLALVNPLLALLPFIETGPGKESDCAGLLARAKDWSQRQSGAARGGRIASR
jgi:uncharacterized protein involved in outer membrane biogenesis